MYLYENAIIENINKLFTNSKVCAVIADSLSEGLRRVAANKEDKITLPAIILVGGDWSLNDSNFYSLMHGSEFERVEEDSLTKNTSVMSFTPSYSMYIIAQSSRECDMLTREIIFHYSMHPTLVVNIPYGINKIHTFNLNINKNIPKSQTNTGFIYRVLNFDLQGAYLWHNNTFNVNKQTETTVREEMEQDV